MHGNAILLDRFVGLGRVFSSFIGLVKLGSLLHSSVPVLLILKSRSDTKWHN